MKKIFVLFFCIFISFITACDKTSNEPCSWCDNTPTRPYETSNGETVYVCDDCSSECMLCHKEAKHHYTALAGEMFVCDDCYEEIKEINGQ